MILLDGTTETLTISTSSTADIDYSISYVDIGVNAFAPGATEGKYVAANTANAALGSPAASTQRQVKLITISNRHASTSNTIIVKKYVPTNEYYLTPSVTLAAGELMQYIDGQGWVYYASNGTIKGSVLGAMGVDKSVQFNDGGAALGADADFIYNKANNHLEIGTSTNSGAIALGYSTTDQTAETGKLLLYAKDIAGRAMPKWIGPAGVDNPFQACIGVNGIKQVAPATGTTATTCMTPFATAFTNTATTLVQVAVTPGTIKGIMRSVTLATNGTANAVASHFTTQYEVCGSGGYFFVSRFYVSGTLQSGQRGFHGLANRTAIYTYALSDPIAETTVARVGLGYALTGTVGTWKICAASGTAAMSAVDTTFTVNTTDVIELALYCKPNDSLIGYRVTNLTSAAVTSGTINTNIPATSVALGVHHFVTNNTTAGIATFGLNKWYLESDY